MKEVLTCPLLGLHQLCPMCAARIILGVANGKYLTLNPDPFCLIRRRRTPNVTRANARVETRPPLRTLPAMSLTLDQIVAETRQLPREQVAELVDRLTFELHDEPDPENDAAWAEEAERRLAEIRSGKVQPIPGEEVMARARKLVGL